MAQSLAETEPAADPGDRALDWLNPPDPYFDEKVKDICEVYLSALERDLQGERTLSIDEMTGIQAHECLAPELPMRPGQREQPEFEYTRHGTQSLIASFDIAHGRVGHAMVGDTHTEADFATHLKQLISTGPHSIRWHLVMDCLNTRQSESLMLWVAHIEELQHDLEVIGNLAFSSR